MGFLSDLVLARDLLREVTAGVREMNAAVGGGGMSPLGPGGAPFGPMPPMAPGGVNPGVRPGGLQPLTRAATLLGPSGQPISVIDLLRGGTSGIGGGSGGSGGSRGSFRKVNIAGLDGGGGDFSMMGYKKIGSSQGGGSGGGSSFRAGAVEDLAKFLAGRGTSSLLGGLEKIAMEIQNLRKDQRDTTGLRAKGLV